MSTFCFNYNRPFSVLSLAAAHLLIATTALVGCGGNEGVSGSGASDSSSTTDPMTETTGETVTASSSDTDTTMTTLTDTTPTTEPTTIGPTTSESDTTTDTSGDELMLDCDTFPSAAVDADFTHIVSADGGVPSYSFSAEGLPDGISLESNTGYLSGTPTVAGNFDVTFTVDDSEGNQDVGVCSIVVNEKIYADLSGLDTPCLGNGMSLLDFVTGGTGEAITCSTPGGYGNGKLPQGVTINPDTCMIEGFVAETTYGTWTWIVAGEQSGTKVYAPYCASQLNQAPGAYDITGTHANGDHLVPATATFAPNSDVLFDGDTEPLFLIENNCGNPCTYKSIAAFTGSPFGSGACLDDMDGCIGLCPLIPDQNEPDGDKQIECPPLDNFSGFSHELWAKGDPVPAELEQRPWVISFQLHHCMSNNPADCEGDDNIKTNGRTNLEFSIIMNPE
ncbi:MAG: Ig domain-containing protein [Nannocystaceae bacterium]